jgi:HK97 family phage major capsid protein
LQRTKNKDESPKNFVKESKTTNQIRNTKMSDTIENFEKTLNERLAKIDADKADRNDVAKALEGLKSIEAKYIKQCDQGKKLKTLGNAEVAKEFAGSLFKSLENHPSTQVRDLAKKAEKAGIYSQTGTGSNFVSTMVSDELTRAMRVTGWARSEHDTINVPGVAAMTFNAGDASATWVADDSTAQGTDTLATISRVTITPKTLIALGRVSGQALFNSPVAIAEMIATDLVEAVGAAEDVAVLYGTGTNTAQGSILGYEQNTNITNIVTVTSGANLTIENLFAAKAKLNAYYQGKGAFYLSSLAWAAIQSAKGTANDHFMIDPTSGLTTLAGRPVYMLPQDHNSSITSGDLLALYGVLRNCGKFVTNREPMLDVDYSVDFTKGGIVWRLLVDESWSVINPKAVSKVRYIATT